MSKPKAGKARTAPGKKGKATKARGGRRKVAARRSASRRKPAAGSLAEPEVVVAPIEETPAARSDPFYLNLEPSCTLRESADLQFSLVAASGDPVVVDGSAVERIDTAGLQLLVALARREQDAGRKLQWQAASPVVIKSSARLGLVEALGLGALASEVTP